MTAREMYREGPGHGYDPNLAQSAKEIHKILNSKKENEAMYASEETLCTTCIHREVCSKKEEYLSAVKAVKEMLIPTGNKQTIYLRDMKWIRPVRLECAYYTAPRLEVR